MIDIEATAASLLNCVLCIYLHLEAWPEECKRLPGLWMKRTVMSWPGRQKWAEPTETSDSLQLQLERNTRRNSEEIRTKTTVGKKSSVMSLSLEELEITCRNQIYLEFLRVLY